MTPDQPPALVAPLGPPEETSSILVVWRTFEEALHFQAQWGGTVQELAPLWGVRLDHEDAARYVEQACWSEATWGPAPRVEEALQEWAAMMDEDWL